MRSLLPLVVLLASCAEAGGPPVPTLQSSAVSTVTPAAAPPAQENCREFQTPITVGGQEQQAFGRACQQPDGTWQIMPPQNQGAAAPGQAAVPPTIIYPAYPYPYYDPWWGPPWWGPPFGVGVGLGFAFGGHHHHHH